MSRDLAVPVKTHTSWQPGQHTFGNPSGASFLRASPDMYRPEGMVPPSLQRPAGLQHIQLASHYCLGLRQKRLPASSFEEVLSAAFKLRGPVTLQVGLQPYLALLLMSLSGRMLLHQIECSPPVIQQCLLDSACATNDICRF